MSGLVLAIIMTLVGCAVETQEGYPQFLLIVREQLRPGSEDAYNENELQLADVCATMSCPHPYLALAAVSGPKEVWWFSVFESEDERDGLDSAYAQNTPLMAAMEPLGKRKEEFRDSVTSTMTAYQPELSQGTVLRIAGARFFVVATSRELSWTGIAVFESSDGASFVISPATDRAVAEDIAVRLGPSSTVLAVQPQWSFPAQQWIEADPEFWKADAREQL